MKLLTLSGSLRKDSLNTAICRTVPELVADGVEVIHAEIGDLPLYDGDLERPASVTRLIEQIQDADAVFISTPEYNYSISGVLKNALDWASRPAYGSCFKGKPVAIASYSPGSLGGVRAQQHLRPVLVAMLAQVYSAPELCVAGTARFEDGRLTDPATRELLQQLLGGLQDFAARLG